MNVGDLDAVVRLALERFDPRGVNVKAKWARRWHWRIDRTTEAARKATGSGDSVFELLATAAVAWLEAQEQPERSYQRETGVTRAAQFLELAKAEI